eukprot:1161696-Pelagomonas_calceolata.AAC.22
MEKLHGFHTVPRVHHLHWGGVQHCQHNKIKSIRLIITDIDHKTEGHPGQYFCFQCVQHIFSVILRSFCVNDFQVLHPNCAAGAGTHPLGQKTGPWFLKADLKEETCGVLFRQGTLLSSQAHDASCL